MDRQLLSRHVVGIVILLVIGVALCSVRTFLLGPSDPAETVNFPGPWIDPQEDAAMLAAVAREHPKTTIDLLNEFDDHGLLAVSLHGLATNDEFGHKVIDCAVAHERHLEKVCRWDNTLVIHRGSRGAGGHVVYADLRPSRKYYRRSAPERECLQWLSCVRDAWQHRRLAYPRGQVSDYLAVQIAGGQIFFAHGKDADGYRDYYVDALSKWTEDVRQREEELDALARQEGGKTVAAQYNLAFSHAAQEHVRLLMNRLEGE